MKKLAFVIRYFQDKQFHGGGEKVFYKIIKFLSEKGYLIDVYCAETNAEKLDNVSVFVIDEYYSQYKPKTVEKFYDKVKELMKDKEYHHIISENSTPPLDITFLHGHTIVYRIYRKSFLSKILYHIRSEKRLRMKYDKKWMEQGYNKIFAVSEIQKKDYIENLNAPEDKITVLPLAHNGMKEFLEKNYNKPLVFGMSAIGFERKGGYIALNAVKKLSKYNFKVKIIYPKWKKNLGIRLFLKWFKLGEKVEFLGFQNDIENFYKSVDIMLIPSLEDTFNLTTIEGMSRGIPAIVSNRAGSYEILTDKKDGFLFDIATNGTFSEINKEKSAENLANTMKYIMDNKNILPEVSKNAYEIAKNYTWDNLFEKFEEAIQ